MLPKYRSTQLNLVPDNHFFDLVQQVREEMERRVACKQATEVKHRQRLHDGLSNFLLGCAHAMACRAALRVAAGHAPFGVTPQHGAVWNPWDGEQVNRYIAGYQPRLRGYRIPKWDRATLHSNPVSWTTVGDITHWLSPFQAGCSTPKYFG
jgi:hypothetical protein